MIHFLLTPDKSSSLDLKRRVAEQCARMDVVVGTWPELLTQARNSHILPLAKDAWQEKLAAAVKSMDNVFWADSLRNVPSEAESIISIVGQHLATLLESLRPDLSLTSLPTGDIQGRLLKRLQDFSELHGKMGAILPPDLAAIKGILEADPERRLRPVRVYYLDGWPRLNPWQKALVTVLNERAEAPDRDLADLLKTMPAVPSAPTDNLLNHLQTNLFADSPEKKPLDRTAQFIACRDYLQETEIAAGMIQKAMADDASLNNNDFALLLPADDRYHQAVLDAFSLAGIPLSGLGRELSGRDLGREAVYYFLLSKKSLAPAMALANLLASPLMPWDSQAGNRLAQKVIKGDFKPKHGKGADRKQIATLYHIKKRALSPAKLAQSLTKFIQSLPRITDRQHPLFVHRTLADDAAAKALKIIAIVSALHDEKMWDNLLKSCQPETVPLSCVDPVPRDGVAVFHEGEEPWRKVRHLLVLGCSEGHYPQGKVSSPVFFDSDLKALRDGCGLDIETAEERGRRQREVFRRQLCSTADEVSFLVPRRDGTGKPLAPSPALAFMAPLLDGVKDDGMLIVDLDSAAGRARVRGLAVADEQQAASSWKPQAEDLELGVDLVALKDGAESPSRLEKLMVSPLAWLFERLRVEPQEWVPEQLDVSAKGILAHSVFEKLFAFGVSIPDNEEIAARVPGILDESITARYPYLQRDEWKVERAHLAKDIIDSAKRWQEILRSLNATVVATEVRLKGVLNLGQQEELQIHGDADLLLELPGNRLFVVDYKKSGSADRRKRMKAGYEHQSPLYGTMIRTGGPEYPDKVRPGLVEELARFCDQGEICSLYYLMNDQQVLTDSSGWLPGSFPGQPEMGDGISREAMPLIEKRVGEVRQGRVELNSEGDEKEFKEKRGINAKYALESSTLVKIYIVGG